MLPTELLLRYHEGQTSASESSEVEAWLSAKREHREAFEDLITIWTHAEGAGRFEQIDTEAAWGQLTSQLAEKGISTQPVAKIRRFSSPQAWMAIAAGLALLLVAGGLWWQQQEVAPSIQLVSNQQNGSPRVLQLPDGSEVSLRKGAELLYPERFEGPIREVELRGEAYFSVVSKPEQPFVVLTENSRTEVLGTEFTIRALPKASNVLLQVAEGRVAFSSRQDPAEREVFEVQEQGVLEVATGTITRLGQPDPNAFAWQRRSLVFEGESLRQVLEQLARYHQLSLTFSPEANGLDCRLYTTWDEVSVADALADLEELFALEYEIAGDELQVSGAKADCESSK
ncbi:MAG: FecR domain-containing protein [Bacteroidota bacterium]